MSQSRLREEIQIVSTDLLGVLLATSAAIFFAVNTIIIRKATFAGEALDSVIATVWINAVVFFPLMLIFYFPEFHISFRILGAFALDGLLGTFLARICLYTGIKVVGASRSVPISQGNLLVSTLFGVLVLGEVITEMHLVGVLILTVGVIIVSYEIESDNSGSNWKPSIGLLLPSAAMVFLGLSAPIGRLGYSYGAPLLVGVSIKSLAGLIFLTGYFWTKGRSPFQPFRLENRHLYILMGITQTAAFGLFYAALSIARVVVVVPFKALTPFFVLVFSFFFLKRLEKINLVLVLGAILTVSGAIFVSVFM